MFVVDDVSSIAELVRSPCSSRVYCTVLYCMYCTVTQNVELYKYTVQYKYDTVVLYLDVDVPFASWSAK